MSLAGAIGTPLGGFFLDRASRLRRESIRRDDPFLAVQMGLRPNRTDGAAGDSTPKSPPPVSAEAYTEIADEHAASLVDAEDNAANPFASDLKIAVAMPQAAVLTIIGAVCIGAGVLIGPSNDFLFFSLLSLGALCLCTTTAGVNSGIMASVPPRTRSLAIGISTLLTHAFGDVPAPPIIGAMADTLSPTICREATAAQRLLSSRSGDTGFLGRSRLAYVLDLSRNNVGAVCDGTLQRDAHGLQVTLFLVILWLTWPALLWAFAWLYAESRNARRRAAAELSAGHALGGQQRLKALLTLLQGATIPFATLVNAVRTFGVSAQEGFRRARGLTQSPESVAAEGGGTELLSTSI